MDPSKVRDLEKILPTPFVDEIQTASTEELKKQIAKAAIKIERIIESREADEELKRLEAETKEIRTPYNDAKKVERARIKYCRHLLGERGAD